MRISDICSVWTKSLEKTKEKQLKQIMLINHHRPSNNPQLPVLGRVAFSWILFFPAIPMMIKICCCTRPRCQYCKVRAGAHRQYGNIRQPPNMEIDPVLEIQYDYYIADLSEAFSVCVVWHTFVNSANGGYEAAPLDWLSDYWSTMHIHQGGQINDNLAKKSLLKPCHCTPLLPAQPQLAVSQCLE